MKTQLIILSLSCFAAISGQEAATTTEKAATKCKKDENGSDYLPNVYECKNTERCCENNGVPSCCSNEIKNDAIVEQAIMWGSLVGVLLIVGIMASCYFKDRYCCDSEDGGCCGAKEKYNSKFNIKEVMFPDEVRANQVADPIFGNTGTADDVPQYASVDTETRVNAKYI